MTTATPLMLLAFASLGIFAGVFMLQALRRVGGLKAGRRRPF
jgi:hypothetical protein